MREEQTGETRGRGKEGAAHHHLDGVRAQQLAERLTNGERPHARELRRFFERPPKNEAEHAAEASEDEGDAPAVHRHVGRQQQRTHHEAHARCDGHAHRDAREHNAAHQRRKPRRRFDNVGERARQLAAEAEALDQPKQHDRRARDCAPPGVRRHETHAERRAGHDEHRPQEHSPSAVPIAVVTENDAADRPREVAGGKGAERRHQRHDRRCARKERVGNVLREDAEDDEVVELEGAAQTGEQNNAPACGAQRRRTLAHPHAIGVTAALAPAATQACRLPTGCPSAAPGSNRRTS